MAFSIGENMLLLVPSLRLFGVVLVCGLAIACSSAGRSYTGSNMQETLETEILPNTSKMFVYRLQLPEGKMSNRVHIERGGFKRNEETRGISVGGTTQKRLVKNAAYVVESMGYCREGFLEIDSSASQYNLWLKGECKEGATEDDKKKFGVKQILPVTLRP
jgi:hypothetical protein